jgi:hypothetical protein
MDEKYIINPHWDKVLRKEHQLSDEALFTIKKMLFDEQCNYMNIREENQILKNTIFSIRKMTSL